MEKINTNELARMIADDLTEVLKVKGHRTVPRQTNMPNGTNPSCQTNVPLGVSERVKKALLGDEEYLPMGKPIYNPLEGHFMSTPKIGDKVYIVIPTTKGLIVVVDEFKGTEMEWLLLAQGRLFLYKREAERYKQKCEAVIGAIVAQLND